MELTVLIADDDPGLRQLVADLVASDPLVRHVALAGNVVEVSAVAGRERPDVALVDVQMPGGGGPEAVRAIRRVSPQTRIAALSAHEDRTSIMEMLAAGAIGYIVKGTPPREVLATVHRLARGESSLSAGVTGEVVRELSGQLDRERRLAQDARKRESRIRDVLRRRRLRAVFQPIVDLTSAVIVGVEALSRFTGGARSPSVWFADAASVGMLEELELFALTTAQADATSVPEGVYVSVNVSPSTMCDARFVPTLVLPPQRLVCEVTEHAAIDDYGTLAAALQSFREAGGRLAVDDAGAGYASLHHILKLHPDVIKLDIGLTRAVHEHPARRALVAALVAFSNDIGAGLVAEGIETQAELDALRDLGVGFGQGYHLARPAPIGELLPELSSA